MRDPVKTSVKYHLKLNGFVIKFQKHKKIMNEQNRRERKNNNYFSNHFQKYTDFFLKKRNKIYTIVRS